MLKRALNTIGLMLLILGLIACSPGGDQDTPQPAPQPKPQPKPEEPPLPPPPPVPAPPQGTDYSKPGTHGKIGVSTDDEEKPVIDIGTNRWNLGNGNGLMGSSIAEMRYWDEIHPFKECPDNPIYVFAESEAKTVPKCADGTGYGNVCRAAEKLAWARAVNVIRSCERAPSCRAQVTNTGQKWQCDHRKEIRFQDDDGSEVVIPERWRKQCWTQYKVVCFKM